MTTRAILFDLDDTLFDHWRGTREALEALQGVYPAFGCWSIEAFVARHSLWLERYHLDVLARRLTVDEARLKRFSQLLTEAGEAPALETAARVAADYREAYVAAWRTVPGVLELLEALHPHAPIGIISNNVVGEQLEKIRVCGLEPYLDTIVISEEAGVAKPDPRIFSIALARIGCEAEEAVMVGDAWENDVVGARAAGIRAVWFNRFDAATPGASDVEQIRSFEPADEVVDLLLG
ncbi:MAG: HAD family hydrolase [Acidobacteriota bacterium]